MHIHWSDRPTGHWNEIWTTIDQLVWPTPIVLTSVSDRLAIAIHNYVPKKQRKVRKEQHWTLHAGYSTQVNTVG